MRAGAKPFADRAPMALTLGVWLCALPFVLLLLVPLFGLKAALLAAGGLLMVLGVICWEVCSARAAVP